MAGARVQRVQSGGDDDDARCQLSPRVSAVDATAATAAAATAPLLLHLFQGGRRG